MAGFVSHLFFKRLILIGWKKKRLDYECILRIKILKNVFSQILIFGNKNSNFIIGWSLKIKLSKVIIENYLIAKNISLNLLFEIQPSWTQFERAPKKKDENEKSKKEERKETKHSSISSVHRIRSIKQRSAELNSDIFPSLPIKEERFTCKSYGKDDKS